MSIKTNVLKKLEENRGSYLSGEELASSLGVSRAGVWKAIKQLEGEGYQIDAVTNRGYCFSSKNDVLSVEGIRSKLPSIYQGLELRVEKVIDSTNKLAKLSAIHGSKHGSVFLAEEQSAGRGRRGRSFLSMKGNNIFMSMILKPSVDAKNVVLITTAASVAVHRAIAKVTGIDTQIKWVNDLYHQDKKVCGILTEAVTDCESGIIDSIILGIGINFNTKKEDIPKEIQDIAGALYDGDSKQITRNELIAEIIPQVLMLSENLNDTSFLEEYRKHSMVIGKDIFVMEGENKRLAKAVGIQDNGGLHVIYEDGSSEVLSTGEISIRVSQ